MSKTIKIRRGNNVNLPAGGTVVGEPRFSLDTGQLFIDDGTNNVEFYNASKVDTISGSLNSKINTKQDAGDYATSAELLTASGVIVSQIPNDYYTTGEVDTISGSLQYQIDNITVSGGGDSLPDQTGNAGKYLATDGTDAYWATVSGTTSSGSYLEEVVDDTTPQLGGDLDLNGHYIEVNSSPSSDESASGIITTVPTPSLANKFTALYVHSTGSFIAADASTKQACLALNLETGDSGDKKVLLCGFVRNDAWTWTVGGTIYLGNSGAMTQTAPTTVGYIVQVLGVATHADRMFFNPSPVVAEIG